MGWSGIVDIQGTGKLVRLGQSVVYERASFTVTGARGDPDSGALFEIRDGRPECIEVSVKAKPTGRAIRQADMALFSIENLTANVFAEVGTPIEPTTDGSGAIATWPAYDDEVPGVRADVATARRRRGSVNDAELRKVAEVYLANLDNGPTAAVEVVLGYTRRTADRRVEAAKAAGFIPTDGTGKRTK
jgi:hypothetical protein